MAHHVQGLSVASSGLNRDKFYVLSGGLAHRLEQLHQEEEDKTSSSSSSSPSLSGPLWSSSHVHTRPDLVLRAHADYLRAGAQLVTTCTYQCSVELFRQHLTDLDDPVLDPVRMFQRAVQLAEQANLEVHSAPRYSLVGGSVGPYGACLADGSEYTGNYLRQITPKQLEEWHFERIKRLVCADVDFIAVETIPSVIEALAILNVIEQFPGVQCWVSFQCGDAGHTAFGEPFDECVRRLMQHPCFLRNKLLAVGVNCTNPRFVTPLLKLANRVNCWQAWPHLVHFNKLRYVVYPNSGEDWDGKDKKWSGDGEESYILSHVEEWMNLGANIVGGCCRIGPDVIAKLRDKVFECMLDVLDYRRAHEKRDNREDWTEVKKRLKKKGVQGRKKKGEEEKEKNEEEEEDVIGPMYAVPGTMSQQQMDGIYQRLCDKVGLKVAENKVSAEGEGEEGMEDEDL